MLMLMLMLMRMRMTLRVVLMMMMMRVHFSGPQEPFDLNIFCIVDRMDYSSLLQ